MDQDLWPHGLRVMVIDNNSSYLSIMEEQLLKCNYMVTTSENVREAMSFISSNLQTVDLIISDVFFPTEDGLFILQEVASRFDIPTVIMSSSGDTNTVMKYITNGASDFLIKPVRTEELKNIWQHVFRKQIWELKKKHGTCGSHEQYFYPPTTLVDSFADVARTTGIVEANTMQKRDVQEINGLVTDIQDLKKARLSWTVQLQRQFIAAVNFLGADKAVPKKILETMKVKHLTREQVSSHLQIWAIGFIRSSPDLKRCKQLFSLKHFHEKTSDFLNGKELPPFQIWATSYGSDDPDLLLAY